MHLSNVHYAKYCRDVIVAGTGHLFGTRRLFEHLKNTSPRRLIETWRLLETRRLFVSCTNGKYWHPSVREINAYTTSFPKNSNLVDRQWHPFLCAYQMSIMLNSVNLIFSIVAVRGAHIGPVLARPTENIVGALTAHS